MTTPPGATEPPFALDGTVTRDKLLELLAVQAELPELDYKEMCDLGRTAGAVELAKDVGAMRIKGGYLVVGADGTGKPVGMDAATALLFDESRLRPKLEPYVGGGAPLRSAVHDLGDAATGPVRVALVWVGPHPDGWCTFVREGQYRDQHNQNQIAFRKGEVYARHGTSSEPWNQADAAEARARLVAREKETWRAEQAEFTRHLVAGATAQVSVAGGPADAFTWRMDAAGFEAGAVELLRRDDDVPVRRMLQAARLEAARLLRAPGDEPAGELVTVLDRVTTVAALGTALDRPAFLDLGLSALFGLYELGVELEQRSALARPAAWWWLRLAARLYTLGGLAVRSEAWPAVRRLATATVPGLVVRRTLRTWHRHGAVRAGREGLLQQDTTNGPGPVSLLMFARAVAAGDPALRPDLDVPDDAPDPDPLLASIAQFDFLVTVISAAASGATTPRGLYDVAYPNFATVGSCLVGPVTVRLVREPAMRAALLPGVTDEGVADALGLVEQVARDAGWDSYTWDDGYPEPDVAAFLGRHRPGHPGTTR